MQAGSCNVSRLYSDGDPDRQNMNHNTVQLRGNHTLRALVDQLRFSIRVTRASNVAKNEVPSTMAGGKSRNKWTISHDFHASQA